MPQMAGGGSSSSQATSTPINMQLPAYTGLAPSVASGLQSLYSSLEPGGYLGGPGGLLSPFMAGGFSTKSPNNPLVAQMTPQQTQTLGQINTNLNNLGPTFKPAFAAVNRFLSPDFASSLATSPQTKAAISSALEPITNTFRTQTMPGLSSGATAAGQRVNGSGGMGSSAFDQAFAAAQGNELATEAATSGSLANAAYQTGLNINANAPSMAAGLTQTELGDMINGLNAEALPQLTQQYGISAGLQLYQQQLQTLMQALGLGGQISQPAIAYNMQSSSQSQQNGNLLGGLSSLLGGFGGLFASPAGA